MLRFYRTTVAVFVGLFVAALFFLYRGQSAPSLANYYLGTLPTDAGSVSLLAKNDLLILSPEQALVRRAVIDQIKRLNPDIILLAYVPAQSYNNAWRSYPANTLYKNFSVKDEWWLRDPNGKTASNWPGLSHTNLSHGWSDYYIDYIKANILTAGVWDGVFWDMIYDNISWLNDGNIDLNSDGKKDDPTAADAQWTERTVYLLEQSRARLPVKYIIMNGSSVPAFQEAVNGRMYESYPTSWEAGGNWGKIMAGLIRNSARNSEPRLYIFNSNTGNTGKKTDYRKMRFGLASSLMADNVYFSFDFGTENHAQIWQYDEYEVKLGEPLAPARSLQEKTSFQNDVWRRDYTHGLALVNATYESQEVDLGGEYEKIIGQQDPAVNDGVVTDRVRLGARDGLVMLKTFQQINDVVYTNGNFIRFFDQSGNRARNGFFAFDEAVGGGAKIFYGDLDGDSQEEKITVLGPRLQIFNSRGEIWLDDFPFGANFKGDLRVAVGRLSDKTANIIVAPSTGGKAIVYNYFGQVIKSEFYPFGKKYQDGLFAAIGNIDGGAGEAIFATDKAKRGEVIVFDSKLAKTKKRFFPYGKESVALAGLAVGDINGDKTDEIIALDIKNKKPRVRILNKDNKILSQFSATAGFGGQKFAVAALDVNYDGADEVMLANGSN